MMKMNEKIISEQIRNLQSQLDELLETDTYDAHLALQLSEEIDKLIVRYYQLKGQ